MDLEPARSIQRHAERHGYVSLRRLSAGAPLVCRRQVRPVQPRGRCVARRYRRKLSRDLLAERVQPGAHAIPAHQLRTGRIGQRAVVPVSILNWSARGASFLGFRCSMKHLAFLFLGAALSAASASAQSKLTVVTTTEDLASIGREVGGDHISIESLARGYQDPHFVEAKPSFILKLQKADLLVAVGRELEIGWLPPLIQQSRNSKIQPGSQGYLDASLGATILEIPSGTITRAMGDVHPLGNPHYWMDPENGKRIGKEVADKLSEIRPNDRAYFQQRLADFTSRLDAASKRWRAKMAPYKGTRVGTPRPACPA